MTFSKDKYSRYRRQTILKEFGEDSQDKLLHSKVLVVGAGGLGCPALQYLSASGVGVIGIADFDTVEMSNLHRQILFSADDVGKQKAIVASEKIRKLNPDIEVKTYPIKITNHEILEILAEFDMVLDGSDNFTTRYLLNDACVLLNKPYIYGAVSRFEGQVGIFNVPDPVSGLKTSYRDLFPHPPAPDSIISCNEAGVLGVLPGIIGTWQAAQTIKLITGLGNPLINAVWSMNLLNHVHYKMEVLPNPHAVDNMPLNESEFRDFNYPVFCGVEANTREIEPQQLPELLANDRVVMIDVRENSEYSERDFNAVEIPLSTIKDAKLQFTNQKKVVVFCQSGLRSLKAIKILADTYRDVEFYNLRGGYNAWETYQQIHGKRQI